MYEVLCVYANWSHGHQKQIAMSRVKEELERLYSRKQRISLEDLTPHNWRIRTAPFMWDLMEAANMDRETGSLHHRRDVMIKYFGKELMEQYTTIFGLWHDPYQIWVRMEKMIMTDWYTKAMPL